MKALILTLTLSIAAGHVNASEQSLSDRLASSTSEAQCLSILEDLGNESEALVDQCMDQDYNN